MATRWYISWLWFYDGIDKHLEPILTKHGYQRLADAIHEDERSQMTNRFYQDQHKRNVFIRARKSKQYATGQEIGIVYIIEVKVEWFSLKWIMQPPTQPVDMDDYSVSDWVVNYPSEFDETALNIAQMLDTYLATKSWGWEWFYKSVEATLNPMLITHGFFHLPNTTLDRKWKVGWDSVNTERGQVFQLRLESVYNPIREIVHPYRFSYQHIYRISVWINDYQTCKLTESSRTAFHSIRNQYREFWYSTHEYWHIQHPSEFPICMSAITLIWNSYLELLKPIF